MGPGDIVELDLDAQPVRDEDRSLYLERFIHAAIFAARPEVMAVVHAHAEDTLPFGIAQGTKLRPVIHSGSYIGTEVPVWDIADNFGANLLVTNMAQATGVKITGAAIRSSPQWRRGALRASSSPLSEALSFRIAAERTRIKKIYMCEAGRT